MPTNTENRVPGAWIPTSEPTGTRPPVRAQTTPTAPAKAETRAPAPEHGISTVQVPDSPKASAPDVVTRQTGLSATPEEASRGQLLSSTQLALARSQFTSQVLEKMAATGQTERWAAFVAQTVGGNGALDINTMVQEVLRQAYKDQNLDLAFHAQKVSFYNDLKKQIRDEATKARAELAKYAGVGDDALLDPPYPYKNFDTTPAADGSVQSSVDGQDAVAQYEAAQSAYTAADQQAATGGGVHKATDAEKAALSPPAQGDVFITADGHRIDFDKASCQVVMYDAAGKELTRIWGDPHVEYEGKNGQDGCGAWSFGDDSTFILPDGTKLSLNTEETSPGSGIYVTKGIDILSGEQHAYDGLGPEGQDRPAGSLDDRVAWDAAHADTMGTSGGIFALLADGSWAKQAADGKFYKVDDKSWGDYKSSHTVSAGGSPVAVSAAQVNAGNDALERQAVVAKGSRDTAEGVAREYAAVTKADLETYVKNTEEKLNSVGDDAQLANVDLQNMLQKQQQTLQMTSNISKMLSDTALAVIRKIGG